MKNLECMKTRNIYDHYKAVSLLTDSMKSSDFQNVYNDGLIRLVANVSKTLTSVVLRIMVSNLKAFDDSYYIFY